MDIKDEMKKRNEDAEKEKIWNRMDDYIVLGMTKDDVKLDIFKDDEK